MAGPITTSYDLHVPIRINMPFETFPAEHRRKIWWVGNTGVVASCHVSVLQKDKSNLEKQTFTTQRTDFRVHIRNHFAGPCCGQRSEAARRPQKRHRRSDTRLLGFTSYTPVSRPYCGLGQSPGKVAELDYAQHATKL